MPKEGELSLKQHRFVLEYIRDFNGVQAVIRAGYSKTGASVTANRLLANPKIQKVLAREVEKQRERLRADADDVLHRLIVQLDADEADLFEDDGMTLKPIHEWPPVFRTGLIAGFEIDEIKGPENTVLGHTKRVKLVNRTKHLEMLGRHKSVRAFVNQHEHTGKDGGPIETSEMTQNEKARRVLEAMRRGLRDMKQEKANG